MENEMAILTPDNLPPLNHINKRSICPYRVINYMVFGSCKYAKVHINFAAQIAQAMFR
jgi:hypothetical protein